MLLVLQKPTGRGFLGPINISLHFFIFWFPEDLIGLVKFLLYRQTEVSDDTQNIGGLAYVDFCTWVTGM